MNLIAKNRIRPSETDARRSSGNLRFDLRSPLDSDYGRLVFSSAFRRLHDKTQVFPLTTNDNIHSRLTHSIEVASVGRSFAISILNDTKIREAFRTEGLKDEQLWRDLPVLLEVICLAHDIGNPPLGHFGEVAIQCYFSNLFKQMQDEINGNEDITRSTNPIIQSELKSERNKDKTPEQIKVEINDFLNGKNLLKYDYTYFDGNAEGFRVLTKLQFLNDLYGLNLTCASLASFLKYPNLGEPDEDGAIGLHKHGVFVTEKDVMTEAMDKCGILKINEISYNRHPLSFLMEAADTICYLLMDLEDSVTKGWISFDDIKELLETSPSGLKLVQEAGNHYTGNDPQKKCMVQLRSELMSHLVDVAYRNFSKNFDDILKGDYKYELVKDDPDKLAKIIGKFSKAKVYSHKEIENLELTGDAVITGLLDYYVKFLFHDSKQFRFRCKHVISKSVFLTTLQEHIDYYGLGVKAWNLYDNFDPADLTFEEKFRIIRDHVACMTDKYAVEQYQKLSGHRI